MMSYVFLEFYRTKYEHSFRIVSEEQKALILVMPLKHSE